MFSLRAAMERIENTSWMIKRVGTRRREEKWLVGEATAAETHPSFLQMFLFLQAQFISNMYLKQHNH